MKLNHKQFLNKVAFASLLLAVGSAMSGAYASEKVKVGLMLPETGTFAALGTAIANGFKLYVSENGGKLGGKEVEYFQVDDESDPAKATENANKLIKRDKVDVLVGTVHSGVALAMGKVSRDNKTLLIVPNAGADELTGPLCSPYLFRTSFSMWQPSFAMGKVAAEKGNKKVVTLTWNYAAGKEAVNGFKEGFEAGGGKVMKDMTLSFPNVEFQPFLTEIASMKPDAVYVFFAGAGAAKFVKDYAAAGLNKTIPLYATGFLTEGTLEAIGDAGDGVFTTLHYADGIDSKVNKDFRANYAKKYNIQPDVYAVQGYDAAQLYAVGIAAAGGDASKQSVIIKAMQSAKIESPRGSFTLSKAHNPIQNIYLRQVSNKENKLIGVAVEALADPARGCKL